MSYNDDEDEELVDREMPDEADLDDSDSVDTETCPRCGKAVYEQAEQCHYCGQYISHDRPAAGWTRHWVVVTIVCVLILVSVWIAMHHAG